MMRVDPERRRVGDFRLWSLVIVSSSDGSMRTKGLRIGLIAPPWVAVPPPFYGGTEVVVDHLARGLVAAGHQVSLFTTGDSTCPVERHWVLPEAVGTTGSLIDELGHVQAAYAQLAGCEVIHDHTLLGPLWAIANAVEVPVVTTNHGEFTRELTELYRSVGQHVAVVAISHHQASTAPTVPVARVIHHGIDVDTLPVGRGDGGYVVFLGRMHPDKGVHRAIEVARAAGKRLLIAAKMWEPAEHQYYAEQVEPLLGPDAVYLGQVGAADKHDLLAGAEALINPIRWPEPFGLVMIEAMACGTPIIAFNKGSVPEVVEHGRTGFVVDGIEEAVVAVHKAPMLSRSRCRAAFTERFSARRMAEEYVRVYRELIVEKTAQAQVQPIPWKESSKSVTNTIS
jgi:glycosyltransferase involved in cell wall biosynthesis